MRLSICSQERALATAICQVRPAAASSAAAASPLGGLRSAFALRIARPHRVKRAARRAPYTQPRTSVGAAAFRSTGTWPLLVARPASALPRAVTSPAGDQHLVHVHAGCLSAASTVRAFETYDSNRSPQSSVAYPGRRELVSLVKLLRRPGVSDARRCATLVFVPEVAYGLALHPPMRLVQPSYPRRPPVPGSRRPPRREGLSPCFGTARRLATTPLRSPKPSALCDEVFLPRPRCHQYLSGALPLLG